MIRVKILETVKGSPDGIQVFEYREGEVCDLPSSLASIFLEAGYAEEVKIEEIEEKKELESKKRRK